MNRHVEGMGNIGPEDERIAKLRKKLHSLKGSGKKVKQQRADIRRKIHTIQKSGGAKQPSSEPASTDAAMDSTETVETSEFQKQEVAIQESVRLGRLVHEVHGDPSAEHHVTIMGSAHFPKIQEGKSLARQKPDVAMAQAHMLSHMHVLEKHKAEAPVFVEGLGQNENCPRHNGPVGFPSGTYNLQTPQAQAGLFQDMRHTEGLMNWLYEQQRLNPVFYSMTTYNNIQGAHADDVLTRIDERHERIARIEGEFYGKYRPSTQAAQQANTLIDAKQNEQGEWCIHINSQDIAPEELYNDATEFITMAINDLRGIDTDREEEMAEHFANNPNAMGWVGLAHVPEIVRLCKEKGICVHVLHSPVEESAYKKAQSGNMTIENIIRMPKILREFAWQHMELNAGNTPPGPLPPLPEPGA